MSHKNRIVLTLFRNAEATGNPTPRNEVFPASVDMKLKHGNNDDEIALTIINTRPCPVEVRFANQAFAGLSLQGGGAYYARTIAANSYEDFVTANKSPGNAPQKIEFVFDTTLAGCASEGNVGSLKKAIILKDPGDDPQVYIS